MLGKLIKHEWRAFSKTPLIAMIGLLIFTIYGIFTFSLEFWSSDNPIVQALMVFFVFGYVICICVISYSVIICTALRFYKNIYTDEGYLMHTLPVSQASLILSKTIVSFVWILISVIAIAFSMICLSVGILLVSNVGFSFGDILQYMFRTMNEMFTDPELIRALGMTSGTFMILVFLLMISGIINSILMIYASVSIGQLFHKHRVLGAFVSYIGIYSILQFAGTLISIPLLSTYDSAAIALPTLLLTLVGTIVLSVVFFFLTEWIMRKKLNLE